MYVNGVERQILFLSPQITNLQTIENSAIANPRCAILQKANNKKLGLQISKPQNATFAEGPLIGHIF